MSKSSLTITPQNILEYFPIQDPFRFFDTIIELDDEHILGSYTFKQEEFFYKGHFPFAAITPGSIMLEAGAQIGLVAFGMYLLGNRIVEVSDLGEDFVSPELEKLPGVNVGSYLVKFYLVDSEMKYKKVVLPGDTIFVRSELVFFKLNKIKCKVSIHTENNEIIAKGILSGMINVKEESHAE